MKKLKYSTTNEPYVCAIHRSTVERLLREFREKFGREPFEDYEGDREWKRKRYRT